MELTDNMVLSRRLAYGCCAAEYEYEAMIADQYGDQGCADKKRRLAEAYLWAEDVMKRTALPSQPNACQCISEQFALSVIKKMDPGCVSCACGSNGIPLTCDIDAAYTVYVAADASQQTVIPDVAGRAVFIISDTDSSGNAWAAHVGEIAINDGAGAFTYTTVAEGLIVLSSVGSTYYLQTVDGPAPLYPPINGVSTPPSLTLSSDYPAAHGILPNRDIAVEVSEDGMTWIPVYTGPETVFTSAFTVPDVPGLPSMTRARYYYGEFGQCSSPIVNGGIPSAACAPDITLGYGADAFEQGTLPNSIGIQYLIISDDFLSGNQWSLHVGEIAVGNGLGGWTYIVPPVGSKVLTSAGWYGTQPLLWNVQPGGAAQFYPALTAVIDYVTLTISTPWQPEGHNLTTRDVVIEVAGPDDVFTVIYAGPEIVLQGGYTNTIPEGQTQVRVTYLGVCSASAPVTTSVVSYSARSLRIPSGSQIGPLTPLAEIPAERLQFSFGTYLKMSGNLSLNGFELALFASDVSGVDGGSSYFHRISLSKVPSNGNEFYIEGICGQQVPSQVAIYYRYIRINGLQAILADGLWHSIDIIKGGPAFSFEEQDFNVFVDGAQMPLSVFFSVGDLGDIPGSITWAQQSNSLVMSFQQTAGGVSALWKNTYYCHLGMSQSQVQSIAVPGTWEANAGTVGLVSLWNYDFPDVNTPSAPYIGSRFPIAPPTPVGGPPFAGGRLANAGVSGAVFENDVPLQLITP